VASLGAFPAVPTGKLPEEQAAKLQAVLDRGLNATRAPGMAAAIIVADQGTWAGAAGTADGSAPLDPAAQFGIGSVTKTVIAAQVLQLAESGAVDLDRPIADYLGAADFSSNGATVREVLGMRSGIGDVDADPRATCADLNASVSMDDLREVPLLDPYFEPGTQFRYTNANYDLAGFLIEDATGSSVAHVLRSGVLSTPGLERLIYQDEELPTPPLAAPFVVLPGEASVPGPRELLELGGGYLPARCLASSAGPAGGMASDALTLARWGYLLYGGWILSDASLEAMADFKDGYGLAAHDHESRFSVPALGHEGTVPGYTTQLLAFPDDGIAVAVLMNTNGSETELTTIAGRLHAALAE
jgi:CubicO group peptidase (beta-lactamase class C family)